MNGPPAQSSSNPTSVWRIAAGLAVLAGLVVMGALLAPVYLRNLRLQEFVRAHPAASDDALRQAILDKGRALGLDIAPGHLQIRHVPADGRTEVRYVVRVTFPLYTVDLHFSSNVQGGDGGFNESNTPR